MNSLVATRLAEGERVVAMKLSLTTADAQARAGADGQIYGFLTDAMQLPNGCAYPPGVSRAEAELALVLDDELHGTQVAEHDVLAHLCEIRPAFDLPSPTPMGQASLASRMRANNANARYFLVGEPVAAEADFIAHVAIGQVQYEVKPDLNRAARAVARLAREIAIPAGRPILTGALTGVHTVSREAGIELRIASSRVSAGMTRYVVDEPV